MSIGAIKRLASSRGTVALRHCGLQENASAAACDRRSERTMKTKAAILGFLLALAATQPAFPWGDNGHKTIALIARQCLTPSTSNQVMAMLAADDDPLTPHDIASEATWADKYRDMDDRTKHYQQTQNWHFTDIEIDNPDLTKACFGRNPPPPGMLASNGPAAACAVDKIEQFEAELVAPDLDAEERLFALKFLLHLVGDLHQPLHSSDNHDRGGNDIKVIVDGFPHNSRDELHGFWDTQFVDGIAGRPAMLAGQLLAQITVADATAWAAGSPGDWAMETFNIAKTDAYGNPPPLKNQILHLDANYVDTAEVDVRLQLSRAGIRLAHLLNKSLGSEHDIWADCLHDAR